MITLSEDRGSMKAARASLAALPKKMIEGAQSGLSIHSKRVLVVSLAECPILTGALRSTGRVTPVRRTGDRLQATLAYGGVPGFGVSVPTSTPQVSKRGHVYQESSGVDYAVYVHENLEAHHAPPTKAKFLEGPCVTEAPKLPSLVRTEIDARLVAG